MTVSVFSGITQTARGDPIKVFMGSLAGVPSHDRKSDLLRDFGKTVVVTHLRESALYKPRPVNLFARAVGSPGATASASQLLLRLRRRQYGMLDKWGPLPAARTATAEVL